MKGNVRNYFPGGNTSKGFYSYYQYIIGQKEAQQIIYIKGGPGTGKSTFMKCIADHFRNNGEDVDCFWCSSDPESLDAVLLRERRIAFMDGTNPHTMDPQNPGAVDTILYFGDYWQTEKLKNNKNDILKSNSNIKRLFECAYANLEAASILSSLISSIYEKSLNSGEVYKFVDELIENVIGYKPVSMTEGECRKYFSSAITHKGQISHMPSVIRDYKKLYMLLVPEGLDISEIMSKISDSAIHRGFSVEQYYSPMNPIDGIEHVLIPEIKIGFMTLNGHFDYDYCETAPVIANIDMREFVNWNEIETFAEVIENFNIECDILIKQAIVYLQKAKQEHDVLEGYYVPNMNFEKIRNLTAEWIAKIERNEL